VGLCKNVHRGKITGPMNFVTGSNPPETAQRKWCYHALSWN